VPDLLAFGLSHKTAPLELREKLALPEGRAASLMVDLTGSGPVTEATVLSTCNRTELYLVATDPEAAGSEVPGELSSRAGVGQEDLGSHSYSLRGPEVARHLFRVAAGLDSMVLGESEIQGQVKRAHELALVEGASGPILNRLFRAAITAGGRVRSETGIGEKGTSVASVAVAEARRTLDGLDGRKALVIGTGETAERLARALGTAGVEIVFLANRHFDQAQELAARFEGEADRIAGLSGWLDRSDLVFSATRSPVHLIDPELLGPALERREGRPLLLVDLALPRDIDPAVQGMPGVTLIDLDSLQQVVEDNTAWREAEAARAEGIIDSELDLFGSWLESLEVLPVIVELRERAEGIVRQVLIENEGSLENFGESDRERVELIAGAIVQRLLHDPTRKLRDVAGTEAAYGTTSLVRDLFGLDLPDDRAGRQTTVTRKRHEA